MARVPMSRPRRRLRSDPDTVLRAAFALFNENGYDSTTIDQIAQRAGVSRSTIYTHYVSKEDVLARGVAPLLHALQSIFDEEAGSTGTCTSRLTHVIRRLVTSALAQPAEAAVLVRLQSGNSTGRRAHQIRTRFEDQVIALVIEGVQLQEFRSDIPPAAAARLLLSLSNWLSVWFVPDRGWTADQLADVVISIALRGLAVGLTPPPPVSKLPNVRFVRSFIH